MAVKKVGGKKRGGKKMGVKAKGVGELEKMMVEEVGFNKKKSFFFKYKK